MPGFIQYDDKDTWANVNYIRHVEDRKDCKVFCFRVPGERGKKKYRTSGKSYIDCMKVIPVEEGRTAYIAGVDDEGVRMIPFSRVLLYREGSPCVVVDSRDMEMYVAMNGGKGGQIEDCLMALE